MDRPQRGKQGSSGLAHGHRVLAVDVIVIDGLENRFPSLRLNLLSRSSAAVIVGRHLGQNSIPQAERRIAKSFQSEAVEQFVVDDCSGDNDLGPPRTYARALPAF